MESDATLNLPGKEPIKLPIKQGSLGKPVVDISPLESSGFYTFDPGFLATASCESAITYIDGENGILLHRGYTIEALVTKSSYLEVCYLLLHKDLPSKDQLDLFIENVSNIALRIYICIICPIIIISFANNKFQLKCQCIYIVFCISRWF